PRAAGKIHHHPGQRLVEGDIGVAVAADALLVAEGPGKGLAEGDADVLHRVVVVDVGIAHRLDVEVDKAMAGDLVEHVFEEGDTGVEAGLAAAIQVQADRDPGFEGIATDRRRALRHGILQGTVPARWKPVGATGVAEGAPLYVPRPGSSTSRVPGVDCPPRSDPRCTDNC